jgi:hypothetical protein
VTSRAERLLLLLAPAAAVATVALGLRVGAGSAVRAAVVYGAPASAAGTGLAWQVVAFDEDRGIREPSPGLALDVVARSGGREARWHGVTGEDGAAELLLPLAEPAASTSPPDLHLEVYAGSTLLAAGDAAIPSALARIAPGSSWARFSRREGAVVLDVAVLGQRVATGFPASLWVRATDASSHAALAGVDVEAERDSSFQPAASHVTTDARGWAHVVATPVGHAVGVVLHAKAADGRTGEWAGGLYISPGAPQLLVDERVPPGQGVVIDLVVPTVRTTAYVEVDDARGRAWAAVVPVRGPAGEMPRATILAPALAPGLYWAVAADDPAGASELGPGTIARPFFVAADDGAALAMGTDAQTCAPPGDPRDAARVRGVCLALAAATPVPRWTAVDGLVMQHARDAQKRAHGLAIGLVAILVAVLLETVLLLRAAAISRARLRAAASEEGAPPGRLVGRAGAVALALLVALMGFALLAAFLARVA